MSETSVQNLMARATELLRTKNETGAAELLREVLARQPRNADALHLLGCVASRNGKTHEGIGLIRQALAISPRQIVLLNNLGLMLGGVGRLPEAIETFREALSVDPKFCDALHNLGNALSAAGRESEAIAAFERALQIHPDDPALHYNLGNVYLRLGSGAKSIAERKVAYEKSAACYARAVALKPDYFVAFHNLGTAFQALDRPTEAVAAWERSAQLAPNPDAFYNLGRAYYDLGRYDEALAVLDRSITMRPNFAGTHNNRGSLLREMGRLDEAIASFERSISIDPNNDAATNNRLFSLQYHPGCPAERILKEHQRWALRFGNAKTVHANSRELDRRLRIGYISPNFWGHCQALFMSPLLANHDHGKFEIFCYANQEREDSVTQRQKEHADTWKNVQGLQPTQIARLIQDDKIDILVDLTLHMANCMLPVFALKPAPVQITWLGYPGTTGLSAIDYRITDPWLDPPEWTDARYAEKSLALRSTFWCIDPMALTSEKPEVKELPALSTGHITFGSLNNFCKINEQLLRLWGRVLDATPGSRLFMLAPRGSSRRWVSDILGGRADFFERADRHEYLLAYHNIDIGLDTFPYNGHTTSLDSFWMGVPVVTLIGQTVVGRAGYSQLSNLKMPELAAATEDQFVEISAGLATDLRELGRIRGSLRKRMEQSALMNVQNFASDLEYAYRQVWRKWCEKK